MSVLNDVMNDKSIIHETKRIYKYIQSHSDSIDELTSLILSDLTNVFPDTFQEDNIIKIPINTNDGLTENIEQMVVDCISKHFNEKMNDVKLKWDHFYHVYPSENNMCILLKM